MERVRAQTFLPLRARKPRDARMGPVAYAAILAVGAVLWWLSSSYPASMPFWMPWDFSPSEYLATALVLLWFWRGLALAPAGERPAIWRRAVFLIGLALIYAVLQTRFEYWSQHMFFLHRLQHVTMHHLGPFLIALGGAGATIRRGMPRWARQAIDSPARRAADRRSATARPRGRVSSSGCSPSGSSRRSISARSASTLRLDALMTWKRCRPRKRSGFAPRSAGIDVNASAAPCHWSSSRDHRRRRRASAMA